MGGADIIQRYGRLKAQVLEKSVVNGEELSQEKWLEIISKGQFKIKFSARRRLFKLEIVNTE